MARFAYDKLGTNWLVAMARWQMPGRKMIPIVVSR
jgi:hypothetical protein